MIRKNVLELQQDIFNYLKKNVSIYSVHLRKFPLVLVPLRGTFGYPLGKEKAPASVLPCVVIPLPLPH